MENAKNLPFVIMLNWRGYQALRQNSGRYWCRNARWPYAIDRARSQSVFRKASYVGLWAQPINGSGDDRGLCTTLLKCFGLDAPHPIYHIGNRFARDVHRESSGNDAREKSVKKKKRKRKARERLYRRSVPQEMENRSQKTPVPLSHLHASFKLQSARRFSDEIFNKSRK